jgi:thioesterase domain-containing protein
MQSLPKGEMLAIFLPHTRVQTLLTESLSIAAINTDDACVVSGPTTAISELQARLSQQNISSQILQTSHAFHSAMMEPILHDFESMLQSIVLHSPQISFISNLTGKKIKDEEAINPNYWVNHLRYTVQFNRCIHTAAEYSDLFLEIGPGHALSTLAKRCLPSKKIVCVPSLPSMMEGLGQLWVHGGATNAIILKGFGADKIYTRVALPAYPFERAYYWVHSSQQTLETSRNQEKLPVSDTTTTMMTNVEQTLAKLWYSVLGITPLDCNDTFMSLGGHSLLAVQLITKINHTFNKRLAVAWISENNSLKQQADFIIFNKELDYRPIIRWDNSPKGIPLFFIHPGHAGAEVYAELAALLAPEHSLYAIESFNLYSNQSMIDSIEELAQLYLQQIKSIKPEGPYYLGGWSLGGTIAYEVAQRMIEMGELVAHIWMIDSFAFDVSTLSSVEQLDQLFHSIRDETSFQQLPLTYQTKLLSVYDLEMNMLRRYRPKTYSGTITLFNAKQPTKTKIHMTAQTQTLFGTLKKVNGWKPYTTNLTEWLIDADHYSIMHTTHLKYIVDNIKEHTQTTRTENHERIY